MDFVCAPVAFIDGIGGPEMMLVFVIILLLFGGQKLPDFARGLGKTMREFKKAAAGVEDEFKRALEEDERKKSTAATPVTPIAAAALPAPDPHAEDYHSGHYHGGDTPEDPYHDAGPSAPKAEANATPAEGTPAAAETPVTVPAAENPAPAGTPEPEKKPAAPIPPTGDLPKP